MSTNDRTASRLLREVRLLNRHSKVMKVQDIVRRIALWSKAKDPTMHMCDVCPSYCSAQHRRRLGGNISGFGNNISAYETDGPFYVTFKSAVNTKYVDSTKRVVMFYLEVPVGGPSGQGGVNYGDSHAVAVVCNRRRRVTYIFDPNYIGHWSGLSSGIKGFLKVMSKRLGVTSYEVVHHRPDINLNNNLCRRLSLGFLLDPPSICTL